MNDNYVWVEYDRQRTSTEVVRINTNNIKFIKQKLNELSPIDPEDITYKWIPYDQRRTTLEVVGINTNNIKYLHEKIALLDLGEEG